jgi:hypothetical protein
MTILSYKEFLKSFINETLKKDGTVKLNNNPIYVRKFEVMDNEYMKRWKPLCYTYINHRPNIKVQHLMKEIHNVVEVRKLHNETFYIFQMKGTWQN